jgi:hypothetical protein
MATEGLHLVNYSNAKKSEHFVNSGVPHVVMPVSDIGQSTKDWGREFGENVAQRSETNLSKARPGEIATTRSRMKRWPRHWRGSEALILLRPKTSMVGVGLVQNRLK